MTSPRHTVRFALVSAVLLLRPLSAGATELPLTRVILSNAGLAEFTRAGTIDAPGSVALPVRLDQVDDVLKSLVVFDETRAVGSVSLPGKAPLAELFRDLPFGPEALASPSALLNALVGAEVEVAGNVAAKGRIFRVDTENVALPNNGGTVQRHRLTLMTDNGMVQAVVEDVTALRFTDPNLRAQIARALSGIAENRAKDRRELSIGFLGNGPRKVAMSYVVAAPVWKTAYRLVLPKDGTNARLQGWAVVENLTGGDWNNVDLVLVSGNPVALRQRLYTALFAERPEVPVPVSARVVPHVDEALQQMRPALRKAAPAGAARPAAAPPPQIAQAQRGAPPASETGEESGPVAAAAEAEEAATQLLYRFPAKISLATGHTMMVPFIDRDVSAARSWLYQPDVSPRRPLAAVRLRNDGDSGLPAGIVTAYDSNADGSVNFVGDAQLPLLPKGAFKFATFALDGKTDIRRDDEGATSTVLGKAVNGVLTITTKSRRTINYEVTAPPDEDRAIVVEEPRIEDWAPAPDMKGVELTPTRYRFTIEAPKAKTTKASLAIEHIDRDTVTLSSLAPEEILAHISNLQNESPALKDAVDRLGVIVADIDKARAKRAALDSERKKIAADQDRIRRNIQSVGQTTDLGRQYIDTLKRQEQRLAEIDQSDRQLEQDIAAKRQAAEQLARRLSFR
ncbi:MAG TPA: hypothetical protein VG986_18415 [Pseudolabrys sp.]|nr:hypothetical protein [Pseudolabrys sp.]